MRQIINLVLAGIAASNCTLSNSFAEDKELHYKAEVTIEGEGNLPSEEIDVLMDVVVKRPFAGWGTVQKKLPIDRNGKCYVLTKRVADVFGMSVSAEGYYSTNVRLHRYAEPPKDYWNPPDTKLHVELHKVTEPRHLLQNRVSIKYLSEQGDLGGYDLIVRDWVAPQGKGEIADVVFSVSKWANTQSKDRPSLIVTFPNNESGVIRVVDPSKGQVMSECPVGRIAPTDGYVREITERAYPVNEHTRIHDPEGFKNAKLQDLAPEGYWFRVFREGEGHYYGKITQLITYIVMVDDEGTMLKVKMPYLMSPNPNDRNLEAAKSHLSYADYMEDRDQYRKGKTYEDFEAERKARDAAYRKNFLERQALEEKQRREREEKRKREGE